MGRSSSKRNSNDNRGGDGKRKKGSTHGHRKSSNKSSDTVTQQQQDEGVYNDGIAARTRSAPRMVICPSTLHSTRSGMESISVKHKRKGTRSRSPILSSASTGSNKEDTTPQENGTETKNDPRNADDGETAEGVSSGDISSDSDDTTSLQKESKAKSVPGKTDDGAVSAPSNETRGRITRGRSPRPSSGSSSNKEDATPQEKRSKTKTKNEARRKSAPDDLAGSIEARIPRKVLKRSQSEKEPVGGRHKLKTLVSKPKLNGKEGPTAKDSADNNVPEMNITTSISQTKATESSNGSASNMAHPKPRALSETKEKASKGKWKTTPLKGRVPESERKEQIAKAKRTTSKPSTSRRSSRSYSNVLEWDTESALSTRQVAETSPAIENESKENGSKAEARTTKPITGGRSTRSEAYGALGNEEEQVPQASVEIAEDNNTSAETSTNATSSPENTNGPNNKKRSGKTAGTTLAPAPTTIVDRKKVSKLINARKHVGEKNSDKPREPASKRQGVVGPVRASDARAIVQGMESMTIASPMDDSKRTRTATMAKKEQGKTGKGTKELSAKKVEAFKNETDPESGTLDTLDVRDNINLHENRDACAAQDAPPSNWISQEGLTAEASGSSQIVDTAKFSEEGVGSLSSLEANSLKKESTESNVDGLAVDSTENTIGNDEITETAEGLEKDSPSTGGDRGAEGLETEVVDLEREGGVASTNEEIPVASTGPRVPSIEVNHDAANTPDEKIEEKTEFHARVDDWDVRFGTRASTRKRQTAKDSDSQSKTPRQIETRYTSTDQWEIVGSKLTTVFFFRRVSASGDVAAGNASNTSRSRKRLASADESMLETQHVNKRSSKESNDVGSPECATTLRNGDAIAVGQGTAPESFAIEDSNSKVSRRTRSSQGGSKEDGLSSGAKNSAKNGRAPRTMVTNANESQSGQTEKDRGGGQNVLNLGEETSNWKPNDQIAGVGINRIRITPIIEERTSGSVGHQIVQKLLVQYGILERAEGLDPEAEANQQPFVEPSVTAETHGLGNEEISTKETISSKELDRLTGPTSKQPVGDDLVHDYKLPPKQAYRSGRPSRKQALPPILLEEADSESLPKSLQHLSPDVKVDVLNRKTGRVLSGEKAVSIKDLPNLLKTHASYEPIVPPPSSSNQTTEPNTFVREARSSTRSRVCGNVQRQDSPVLSIGTDELVMIIAGPNKGMIGGLDKVLPGGWSIVKLQYPRRGPKIIVDSDHVTIFKGNRAARGISMQKKCSSKHTESIFMNSVKKHFRRRRAEAASSAGVLMSKIDAFQKEGGKNIDEEEKRKESELKEMAARSLAEVDELKRSEKTATAYARSAFSGQLNAA